MNSSISGKGIRQHLENQIKNQIALNSRTVARDLCKPHSCGMYIFHYTYSNYIVVYIPLHVFQLHSCIYSTTRVPTT